MQSLDGIELLSQLTPAERDEVARQCKWKRYAAGEQIIDRQSESRDVLLIVSGAVKVVIYSVSGREVTLGDVAAGGFVGELAAIDARPRSASIMALEDTTIAALPPDHFVRLATTKPILVMSIMRRLTHVIRTATDRIIDLSTLGANNRVHAEILRQARAARTDAQGRPMISPIPIHSDVASRVSTTRETVARVMNDLARAGILERRQNALVVLDLDRLEQMVEEVRGEVAE